MKKREIWVDNVKVIACILVVLGHFFQSMTKSNVIPQNDLYGWFNRTIYYFHVPLFFICSGYLYQEWSCVNGIQSWSRNVLKKALTLGVPYFSFSFVTWILKTIFASSANEQIGGLFDTFFLHPTLPYWYLYALFFLFLITPTFENRKVAGIGLAVALFFKVLIIVEDGYGIPVISYILSNEIWFVIGMCMSAFKGPVYMSGKRTVLPAMIAMVFVALSVIVYGTAIQSGWIDFLLGLMACFSIIMLVSEICAEGKQLKIFEVLSKYTMPIFVMHTLFAAPLRTVLFKLGVQNALLHVILGIAVSFAGPMISAFIMEKSKWLEFFLYPGKFVKIR